ncbi:MAG: hypothetical protein KDI44_14435, partial [Thiothrix sp.]|nr:hypothetical protein [Thiothrix sp.]
MNTIERLKGNEIIIRERYGELTFRVYRHTVELEREEADQIWRRVMDEAERGILLAALELY